MSLHSKPVNMRCTLPRERIRSTISCPSSSPWRSSTRAVSGLLRQITFPEINSRAWHPSNDAIEFKSIAANGCGPRRDQCVPDGVHIL